LDSTRGLRDGETRIVLARLCDQALHRACAERFAGQDCGQASLYARHDVDEQVIAVQVAFRQFKAFYALASAYYPEASVTCFARGRSSFCAGSARTHQILVVAAPRLRQ